MSTKTTLNTNSCRLAFLKIFMAEHGITQKEVSTMLNKSKCAVSHMISVSDDVRLSEIEQILASRKCSIKLSITKDPSEDIDKYELPLTDYMSLNDELIKPRLSFILVAMKRYGVNREELARRIGYKSSTVRYWLYGANDTYISNIIKVAKALGCHLKIKIVNNTQDNTFGNLVKNPSEDECMMIIDTDSVKIMKM